MAVCLLNSLRPRERVAPMLCRRWSRLSEKGEASEAVAVAERVMVVSKLRPDWRERLF